MEIMSISRPLEVTDNEFVQLQLVIEAKRNMLLNKQKKIKKIAKQNEFLQQVKNDYSKYNNYIIKQKEDQMKALDLLNNYIKDLTTSGQLSEHNIKDAKHEQNKIKKELKAIKLGLDNLMNDTNEINNTLDGKTLLI
jgi:hypothetical protein